jgi:hypothetical protein
MVADLEAGPEEDRSGSVKTQERQETRQRFRLRRFFLARPHSHLNKLTRSEEIANKTVSQLQPLGCSKKRFDGC